MHQKLRVLFFTHDSLFSARILHELLQTPTVELIGIIQSTTIMRRKKAKWRDGLRLLMVSGTRYAAYLIKTTVFYKKLAKQLAIPTLYELIQTHTIPVFKSNDVNSSAATAFIKGKAPDVCITAFFNQLLMPHILQLPPKGFINFHPSLLPKNRGVDPVFYAYLRQETSGGVSIHCIDDKLDTGNILAQTPLYIDFEQSLLMNQWQHFDKGSKLLRSVLMDLDGHMPGKSQEMSGNYDGWPSKKIVRKISKLL